MPPVKNPFEVFGLTPDMVGRLSEKELFTVLKAMYRGLAKAYHPDLAESKKTKKATDHLTNTVELNLAFESLNLDKDPKVFRAHRKAFLARRPKSLYKANQALAAEVRRQGEETGALAQAYLKYLLGPLSAPPQSGEAPKTEYFMPLKNVRLGLLDVAISQNLKQASWSLGSNYKQMSFDAEGCLSVKPVGRRRFNAANYIQVLGFVSAAELDLPPVLEKDQAGFFRNSALNARIGVDGPGLSVLNRITPDNFKKYILPRLSPKLTERSYIFSINRPEYEATGCLTLEGLVVKYEPV